MTGPLRLGIAGCGRVAARGYAPAASGLAGVEIAAVADPDRGRAEAVAARAGGAAAFATAEELLAAGGVDALAVCAPAERHAEIAALAAGAGLPSLVEKPPAPDLEGARRVAALRPAPAIGFNRRFLQGEALRPAVPPRDWLELELELRFRRRGWGAHEARDDALLDAGAHLVDLAAFLAGSAPIAVRRAEISEERAELELELGRGRARISCATDRRYAERVEVRDGAGESLAAHRLGPLRARAASLRGSPPPLVLSLRRQLDSFARLLAGGDPGPLAGGEEGVAAMAAVEAARRSAELGGAEVTVSAPTAATEDGR